MLIGFELSDLILLLLSNTFIELLKVLISVLFFTPGLRLTIMLTTIGGRHNRLKKSEGKNEKKEENFLHFAIWARGRRVGVGVLRAPPHRSSFVPIATKEEVKMNKKKKLCKKTMEMKK